MVTVERDQLVALRDGLAGALTWAMTEQGGFTQDDTKYMDWINTFLEEFDKDASVEDTIDRAIATIDELLKSCL